MPTSIPYDESLTLGSVLNPEKLVVLEQIAAERASIHAAEGRLRSSISLKRNLIATQQEVASMEVRTDTLVEAIKKADENIKAAATALIQIRLTAEVKIMSLESKLGEFHTHLESPFDYDKTSTKRLPLAADSLKMDSHYFSFRGNKQDADHTIAAIKDFVFSSTDLGTKRSGEMAATAQKQVSEQLEKHNIIGTLVITATCTHKNVILLEPFVVDIDQAIHIWNRLFDDKIKVDNAEHMKAIVQADSNPDDSVLTFISGAAYGSSFVGMMHVSKKELTDTDQAMDVAKNLPLQMDLGGFIAAAQGNFGVDPDFVSNVKKLLSTQEFFSHMNIITMGAIPTISSQEMQIGARQFTNFDPSEMMDKLATLASATTTEKKTIQEGADAAQIGGTMMQIISSEIQSVMTSLGKIDDQRNRTLDINSLMTAFENYAQKASEGSIGIPTSLYLKSITKARLAQMWLDKYYYPSKTKQSSSKIGEKTDDENKHEGE